MILKKEVVLCVLFFSVFHILNVIGQDDGMNDLDGVEIAAAAFEAEVTGSNENGEALAEPFLYLNVSMLEDWEAFLSYNIDLWFVLMQKLKFRIKMVFPTRNKDKPNSLRELVLDKKAQLTLSPITFTNDTKGVEYAQQIDSGRYKLFIKTPSSETSWSSLGNVFRPVLWFSIVIAMALMAIVLVAIEHVGFKAKLGTYLEAPADTGQLVIVILGNFCYQGAIQIASGCAGRVVIFSSLMCGYLVYISYGTLVISQLTAVKLSLPFENLQQLAARGNYKLLVKNDQSVLEDIETSRKNKSNALAGVWDALLPTKLGRDNLFNGEDAALVQMCTTENVAILASEETITIRKQKKNKCSATSLSPIYFQTNLGYVMDPDNKYNGLLKKTLNRMREVGIMHRWRKAWDFYQGLNKPAEKLPTTLKPITLSTMLPVLGIVGVGILLSIVILILEIIYKKWDDFHTQLIREKQVKMFRTRHPPLPFAQ